MPLPATAAIEPNLTRVLVVGDRDPAMYTHRAIDESLSHVAETGRVVSWSWIHSTAIDSAALASADGIWIAPASPYASADGVLDAIRFAREGHVPMLAVCGGFQHAILEFVRHVLGDAAAAHAETDPDAALHAITPLECSLVGKAGVVFIEADSLVAARYGRWRTIERYHCNYGMNEEYVGRLEAQGLRVVGRDEHGAVRVVELRGHPFFIATLFQPQLVSLPQDPAPLVRAFVDAAVVHRNRRLAALTLTPLP